MTDIITDPKKIDEILDRGTIIDILPSKKDFRDKLLSGQKLKFYIGFDATAPTLHLSHAKNFMLMEKIRRLGHEVIILFGDFTARIGDPSDKTSARHKLSREQVIENAGKWKELIEPLLNFEDQVNPAKIMYNNDWLAKLTMEEIIDLASNFTVQQMIERDMFQKRLKEKNPIYLNEFLYPLMQGYDSVAMDVDVEVCGSDQIFNALAGRTLMKKLKNKEKFVVAVTLMENPKTGELMSKSRGTGVFLGTSANEMFGQVMAQPDEMIEILFVNNTLLSLDEIKEIMKSENPKDAKLRLAFEIVKIFYGKKDAINAQEYFKQIFSKKEFSEAEINEIELTAGEYALKDLLVELKLASSKSEGTRLAEQKAVEINGDLKTDPIEKIKIAGGEIVKVGKYRLAKIKIK